MRKLPFRQIAEEHFQPKPDVPLMSLVKDIQATAQREGRSPHDLLDDLEADAERVRRAA